MPRHDPRHCLRFRPDIRFIHSIRNHLLPNRNRIWRNCPRSIPSCSRPWRNCAGMHSDCPRTVLNCPRWWNSCPRIDSNCPRCCQGVRTRRAIAPAPFPVVPGSFPIAPALGAIVPAPFPIARGAVPIAPPLGSTVPDAVPIVLDPIPALAGQQQLSPVRFRLRQPRSQSSPRRSRLSLVSSQLRHHRFQPNCAGPHGYRL